jgi:hypothetical protein
MAFWRGNRPSFELLPLELITQAHSLRRGALIRRQAIDRQVSTPPAFEQIREEPGRLASRGSGFFIFR